MKKLINLIGKTLIIFILYLFADIALMKLLPNDIKGKIYDKRTHKIKSYYYHHDLRPNAHWIERWGYKNSKIFTNNLGFKDKEIREISFKDNNILFIGDSFTEGVGVEFENTFVGIIEKNVTSKKNNYTVLNAGVTSYSPIVILSKLNYILEKKIPISKVFVVICGADFHDDIYRYISINENYVVKHDDFKNNKLLININNFIKANTLLYQFVREVTPLSNLIARIKNKKIDQEKPRYDKQKVLEMFQKKKDWAHIINEDNLRDLGPEGIKRSEEYLKKIYNLLDNNNIEMTLIFIEEAISMLNEKDTSYYKIYWSDFSRKHNIDFIFIEDYHLNSEDKFSIYKKYFFNGDNHFNNEGNRAVANEILKKSKYLNDL